MIVCNLDYLTISQAINSYHFTWVTARKNKCVIELKAALIHGAGEWEFKCQFKDEDRTKADKERRTWTAGGPRIYVGRQLFREWPHHLYIRLVQYSAPEQTDRLVLATVIVAGLDNNVICIFAWLLPNRITFEPTIYFHIRRIIIVLLICDSKPTLSGLILCYFIMCERHK